MGSVPKLALAGLLLLSFAALPFADYAATTVIFNVPASASFTITLPLSVVTNASQVSQPAGATTSDVNFTCVSGTCLHVQPCLTNVLGGACQTGPAVPIFEYKNTGNVNISMYLIFNQSLPTGVVVGVNSTATGTGNNAVVHAALYDVNNTANVTAFEQLNTSANQFINVTLYANFTSVTGGVRQRLLIHNATDANAVGS